MSRGITVARAVGAAHFSRPRGEYWMPLWYLRAAGAGRRLRANVTAWLLAALAVAALAVTATAPAVAQTVKPEYNKSDIVLPAKVLVALKKEPNRPSVKGTVDGQPATVFTQRFNWDHNLIDTGQINMLWTNDSNTHWERFDISDPQWTTFTKEMKKIAAPEGTWSVVTISYVEANGAATVVTTVPTKPTIALAGWDTGKSYDFKLEVPSVLADEMIKYAGTTKSEMVAANGERRTIYSTHLAWDTDNGREKILNGNFRLGATGMDWKTVSTKDPKWSTFAQKLVDAAAKDGNWRNITVLYMVPTAGQSTSFVVPHSADEMAKRGIAERLAAFKRDMATLSAPTQPGNYFREVNAPTQLNLVAEKMLNYANTERKTPGFRRLVGATVALDVDLNKPLTVREITNKDGGKDKIFPQPDLVLDTDLNKVAQFFAEAMAARRGKFHSYTADGGKWNGKDVSTTDMRAEALGVDKYYLAEVGSHELGYEVGAMPYDWIKGDTHYKWFWGVDARWTKVGFGAAQDAKGKWFYIGVARSDPNN